MVRSLCWWSVEAKKFALSVVGGFTGTSIYEKHQGVTRSILLGKDKAAWLLKFFKDLVTVQDSRVFWSQSIPGFPRILAQQYSNRHGFFLIIEEYEGRRRSGSVLVPKGRTGEGWERFGVELRLTFNRLLLGPSSYSKQPHSTDNTHSKPKPELRRSYVEVLRSYLPKVEEHNVGDGQQAGTNNFM
jgi:hypothetical protein